MRERGNAMKALNTFKSWLSRVSFYWKCNREYEMGGLWRKRRGWGRAGWWSNNQNSSSKWQHLRRMCDKKIIIFDTWHLGLEPVASSSALSQRSAASGRERKSARGSAISHRRPFRPQFIQDCCGIKWDIREKQRSPAGSVQQQWHRGDHGQRESAE